MIRPVKIKPRNITMRAMRWQPDNEPAAETLLGWIESHGQSPATEKWSDGQTVVVVDGADEWPVAKAGDWVIYGVTGTFFVITHEDYEAYYMEVTG